MADVRIQSKLERQWEGKDIDIPSSLLFTQIPSSNLKPSQTQAPVGLPAGASARPMERSSQGPRVAQAAPQALNKPAQPGPAFGSQARTFNLMNRFPGAVGRERTGAKTALQKGAQMEVARTGIMRRYKDLKPVYTLLYERKSANKIVYKVKLTNGTELVLKIEEFLAENSSKHNSLLREFYVGRTFGGISEAVVKTFDIQEIPLDVKGESWTHVEILSEYGGNSLEKSVPSLSDEEIVDVGRQMVDVLALMELRGISHFDLKPANIVWNEVTHRLKLIDFGTSLAFYRRPKQIFKPLQDLAERVVGWTSKYAPPEALEAAAPIRETEIGQWIPQKFDAFTFGVTWLEVLLLHHKGPKLPKRTRGPDAHSAFLDWVEAELVACREEDWAAFILDCLNFDPRERPTFAELKTWFYEIAEDLAIIHPQPPGRAFERRADGKESENEIEIEQDKEAAKAYYEMDECEIALWYYKQGVQKQHELGRELSDAELGSTYDKMGNVSEKLKIFHQALDFYAQAVQAVTKVHGSRHAKVGGIHNNVGVVLSEMRKYKQALEQYNHALDIYYQTKGEHHPDVAGTYNNIGIIHYTLGDLKTALGFYQQALDIYVSAYGDLHPDVAMCYNNIGIVYSTMGVTDKALEHLACSQSQKVRLYGGEHLDLTYTWNNIGTIYLNTGNPELALAYFMRAERVKKTIHGDEHLDLASTLFNIGKAQQDMNNIREASYSYHRAIQVLELSDKGHPYLAQAWKQKSTCCMLLRDYTQALESLSVAEGIFGQLFGAKHRSKVEICYNRGNIYLQMKEQDKAIACYEQAASLHIELQQQQQPQQTTGFEALHISKIYFNMGVALHCANRYPEALESYQKALNTARTSYGPVNSIVALTLMYMGDAWKERVNHAPSKREAMKCYTQAKELWTSLLGSQCSQVAKLHNSMGQIYGGNTNWVKAIEEHEKAEKMLQAMSDDHDLEKAETSYYLYNAYAKRNNHKKALEYLEKSVKLWVAKENDKCEDVVTAYVLLGRTYRKRGIYTTAIEYFKKVEEFYEELYGKYANEDLIACYVDFSKVYLKENKDVGKASLYASLAKKMLEDVPNHSTDIENKVNRIMSKVNGPKCKSHPGYAPSIYRSTTTHKKH